MKIPVLLCLASVAGVSAAGYPAGAGFVNVKEAPFFARGDGVADDTAAIQKAISANVGIYKRGSRTLLFPAGTYVVSDTLDWRDEKGKNAAHLTFQGAGVDKTIFRLKDSAPGFGDASRPKSVIFTRANHNPEWYKHSPRGESLGEGHVAFHNNLFDFTVDIGKGNPGAIGVNFHSSNQGAVSRVRVVSGDGAGVCAFELTRRNVGPSLVSDVEARGFDFSFRFAGLYCVALERASFSKARVAGISNSGGVLAARKVRVTGSPAALANEAADGLLVLLDSKLEGAGGAALKGNGKWLLRNVEVNGFGSVIAMDSAPQPGLVTTWTNGPSLGSAPNDGLPVADSPGEPEIQDDAWARVTDFGAKTDDFVDDTDAIQAALDSGKPGILFPFSATPDSRYLVTKPLVVPPHVLRIAGAFSNIFAIDGPGFPEGQSTPVIQTGGPGGVLLIDRLVVRVKKEIADRAVAIEHAAKRPLVLRHILLNGFRSTEESGDLFLEDVSAHASDPQTFDFGMGTRVWARQLDTEDWNKTKITNRGADFWVLGLKTERPSTVLDQWAGRSEIYGGLFYQHHAMNDSAPALILRSGKLVASFATTTGGPSTQPGYAVLLKDATCTPPRELGVTEAIRRGGHPGLALIPLLCAPFEEPAPKPVPEP